MNDPRLSALEGIMMEQAPQQEEGVAQMESMLVTPEEREMIISMREQGQAAPAPEAEAQILGV